MSVWILKILCIVFLLNVQHLQISEGNVFVFLKSLIADSRISTDKERVKFILYPQPDSEFEEEIKLGNIPRLQQISYKTAAPLKVLVHGFLSNKGNAFFSTLKAAYADEGFNGNIIGVDWTELSTAQSVMPELFYPTAAKNVALVGQQLSSLLRFLIQTGALAGPQDVHLIGFSLGAHICGLAGSYFYKETGTQLERITGLDPAGPLFQFWPDVDRLDKSDAKFVDITHTNKDIFGFNNGLGHADFYVNGGGPIQPRCNFLTGTQAGSCSHRLAYKYYTKSVEENVFACPCTMHSSFTRSDGEQCMKNCTNPIVYGERCPTDARGAYYLEISAVSSDLELEN